MELHGALEISRHGRAAIRQTVSDLSGHIPTSRISILNIERVQSIIKIKIGIQCSTAQDQSHYLTGKIIFSFFFFVITLLFFFSISFSLSRSLFVSLYFFISSLPRHFLLLFLIASSSARSLSLSPSLYLSISLSLYV